MIKYAEIVVLEMSGDIIELETCNIILVSSCVVHNTLNICMMYKLSSHLSKMLRGSIMEYKDCYIKIYQHWRYKLCVSVGIHLNYDDCNTNHSDTMELQRIINFSCNCMSVMICLSSMTKDTMTIDNSSFT